MASLAVEDIVASSVAAAGSRSRRRRWALVGLVSLVGIALSLLLGWFLWDQEQAVAEMQFKLDAGQQIESLDRMAANHLAALDMVAAFFFGSQKVERNEFHAFAHPLIARNRGMELVGWAPRISATQRPAHEQAIRREGLANYQISQCDGPRRFVPAKESDVYYPLEFIEDSGQSQSLFGLDLASNSVCRLAIEQVMTTRRQAAVVGWPLDGSRTDHYLLYVLTPVWKTSGIPTERPAEIDGLVIGVFRVNTIVEIALSLFPPAEIDIYLTGLSDVNGKKPVHIRPAQRSARAGGGERAIITSSLAPEGGMHERGTIDVGGSRCTVDCVPAEAYLSQRRTWGPLGTLLAGLVITGLLVGYLFLLTGRTQQVEQREAEHSAELQSVSNSVFDAVVLMDNQGRVAHWNPAAERMFGYSYDEIVGHSIHETLVPPRYREAAGTGMLAFARTGQGVFLGKVIELEALHKDGSNFPIEISVSPILLDGAWGAVAIIRDVTDRKQHEQILQRERRLLRDMLDLHERDRKLVAYEIHDGLAQQLTAAVYRFQSVDLFRDRDPEKGRETFEEGVRLLREAMVETRRLISGLRPPVLDELGIVAAIDCLIAEKQQTDGPEIEFVHDSELDRLAPPLESSIFRIVQECLTNACRYSHSKNIRVELAQAERSIRIEVRDWGEGFDPDSIQGGHYGLRGIRERARLLGGDVTIQTAPGQGTRITVELPLIVQSDDGTA